MADHVSVGRRALAGALVVALQAWSWSAPLVHAHVDEAETSHHDGRVVHSHASPHRTAARPDPHEAAGEVHPTEDSPLSLQVFVAVPQEAPGAPAVATASFDLPAPRERAADSPVAAEGGHDPPDLTLRSARAPPPLS